MTGMLRDLLYGGMALARYSCGMYGGSFNPLHLGHVRCMISAANQCDRLIVVISHGPNRGEIDIRQRYRWVYQTVKHFPHVQIFVLEDDAPTKAAYSEETWYADAEKVKQFAGEPITAVFFGDDYARDSMWSKCYPEADVVVLPRDGISSTAIRRSPLACWDMMPAYVRSYYVKKVLLIGTESTGKSTLTVSLARHYNTVFLEEVGRDISARSGTDLWMLPEDFTDILLEHKVKQLEMISRANRVFFEDTNCLTTLFYVNYLEGEEKEKNRKLAEAISDLNMYDLVLLLGPDVAFVQDGDRSEEIAADRAGFTALLKGMCEAHGLQVEELNGDYEQRYRKAVELVDRLLEEEHD